MKKYYKYRGKFIALQEHPDCEPVKEIADDRLARTACSPSFSRFDESWKREVMKMPKSAIVDLLKKVCGDRDHAKDCYINLHNAVLATIMENLHLADGDVCTLKILKDAIDFELPPENAGGMARELAAQDSESITDING